MPSNLRFCRYLNLECFQKQVFHLNEIGDDGNETELTEAAVIGQLIVGVSCEKQISCNNNAVSVIRTPYNTLWMTS